MPVTIDPNIKKKRIFINRYGHKITEEQMYNMGNDMGRGRGANPVNEGEEKAS